MSVTIATALFKSNFILFCSIFFFYYVTAPVIIKRSARSS